MISPISCEASRTSWSAESLPASRRRSSPKAPAKKARLRPESRTSTSQVHGDARFADDSAATELDCGGGQAGATVALIGSGHPLLAPLLIEVHVNICPLAALYENEAFGDRGPSNWQRTGVSGT